MKSTIIKKQRQFQKIKKIDHDRKKEMDNKRQYDMRMNEEDQVKAAKEKEVMELEMLEMELIKNLKNTQQIQKNAYSELENALAMTTGPAQ